MGLHQYTEHSSLTDEGNKASHSSARGSEWERLLTVSGYRQLILADVAGRQGILMMTIRARVGDRDIDVALVIPVAHCRYNGLRQ